MFVPLSKRERYKDDVLWRPSECVSSPASLKRKHGSPERESKEVVRLPEAGKWISGTKLRLVVHHEHEL